MINLNSLIEDKNKELEDDILEDEFFKEFDKEKDFFFEENKINIKLFKDFFYCSKEINFKFDFFIEFIGNNCHFFEIVKIEDEIYVLMIIENDKEQNIWEIFSKKKLKNNSVGNIDDKKCHLYLIKFDFDKNKENLKYITNHTSLITNFKFSKYYIKNKKIFQIAIYALNKKGNFEIIILTIKNKIIKKISKLNKKTIIEIKNKEDIFTNFEIIKKENSYFPNKLLITGQTGTVYLYLFQEEKYELVKVYNKNKNFFITSIKLYNFEKSFLFAISSIDGEIKIFEEENEFPKMKFKISNRSISNFYWDLNPTLFYFLDESEENSFGFINLNYETDDFFEKDKKNENVRKNIKSPISILKFLPNFQNDIFVTICKDSTLRIGNINVFL